MMTNAITACLRLTLFILMVTGLAVDARASIDVYEFEDESTRQEFVSLTKELRCPKCQNQDIADSNAPIAADMRKEVHRLLQEGHDRDDIVNHMIERFGDFVTYKPKVSAETLMLWYGPWLFVLLGLIIIGAMVRFKKTSANDTLVKPEKQEGPVFSEDVKKLLEKYDDK
jgi:cytochrome c-type biogenesis protein CcmH